jgi:hypothetical protein
MFYCTPFTISGWQHPLCGYEEENTQKLSMQSYFWNCYFQLRCCAHSLFRFIMNKVWYISLFGLQWIAHNVVTGLCYDTTYISYSTCIFGIMIFIMRIFNGKRFGCRQSTAYLNRAHTYCPHNKDTPYCIVIILTCWYILEDIWKK